MTSGDRTTLRRSGRRRHPVLAGLVLATCLLLFAVSSLIPGMPPAGPERAVAAQSVEPYVGLEEDYWVTNFTDGSTVRIQTILRHIGEHCLVFVEKGRAASDIALQAIAIEFDTNVYPAVTEKVGAEPNPGIDGDPRVALLLYRFGDRGVAGYFYPGDIDPVGASAADSNYREMIYLNIDSVLLDSRRAGSVAAHEFGHLVHYYQEFMLDPSPDRQREVRWIDEALSMYAELAAGYGSYTWAEQNSFSLNPNKNLTVWAGDYLSDYGASLFFAEYLRERFGDALLPLVAADPEDGVAGLNSALNAAGSFETFDTLFDDWVIANFVDARLPGVAPYYYSRLDVAVQATALVADYPVLGTASPQNFGAVYLQPPAVEPMALFRVVVDGLDGAPLHAALVSWNNNGYLGVAVTPVVLDPLTAGGAAEAPPGYALHALAVWGHGSEGVSTAYPLRYSLAVDPPNGIQFLDIGSDHLFFPYIDTLVREGVVGGKEIPAGSGLLYFKSDEFVLRAQFAKMAMEVSGLHTPEVENGGTPAFVDVRPQSDGQGGYLAYPFDYVEEAAAAGIVQGYGDATFRPWEPIKRIQLVRMILRTAAAGGAALAPYEGAEEVFADIPPGSPLYADVMTAWANGILNGSLGSDGRVYFRAWDSATRGQVAKMTANLLALVR